MDTSTYTLDDHVDDILRKISLAPNLTLNLLDLYDVPLMNENAYRLDHFMLEKGLIKLSGNERAITGKGLEIANFGGWIAYQRQFRRENKRSVYGFETIQRKYESELSSLKKELEICQNELLAKAEKEQASSLIIINLIKQNASMKTMLFVAGVVSGLFLASALWYFIF